MKEMQFIEYLQCQGIRGSRIKRIIKMVKKFEKSLQAANKTLDTAGYNDLDSFLYEHAARYVSQFYTDDLRIYYKMTGNTVMQAAVEEFQYKYTPPFDLKGFQNIKQEYITRLNERGIRTNNQLLYSCKTVEECKELAQKTGIPLEEIIKIVKMSDLTRIFAVKATRAQLYYEAGIDSVQKNSSFRRH